MRKILDALIRLLGGRTVEDVVFARGVGYYDGKMDAHGLAVDALTRAHEVELAALKTEHKNGEQRYIGVATKAVDSFRRNIQARLREEFGIPDNREVEDSIRITQAQPFAASPIVGVLNADDISGGGSTSTPQTIDEFLDDIFGQSLASGRMTQKRYTNGLSQ